MLSLPVILYQVYAFVIPAFSPQEKRVVLPYLIAMPLLFIAGIAFAYFLVLPAAINFLLNFNEASFNIQVRASEYYGFLGILVVLLGLLFQMPIALLSLCRLGVVTPRAAGEEPPLRDLLPLDHRRRGARRRPGLDDPDPDPARAPVRGQRAAREALRRAEGRPALATGARGLRLTVS